MRTWKISSLCDSKEWSLSLRFLRSHNATVLSADPVARMNSLYGLKDRQFTSAVWASTVWLGLLVLLDRVSQLLNKEQYVIAFHTDIALRVRSLYSTRGVQAVYLASWAMFNTGCIGCVF